MGAPTALPSGRRAPGRREKRRDPARPSHCRRGSRPGGPAPRGPAGGGPLAQRATQPRSPPTKGAAPRSPTSRPPTCCPGGLSALRRRVPGRRGARPPALRRRWGRAPSQALARRAPGRGAPPGAPVPFPRGPRSAQPGLSASCVGAAPGPANFSTAAAPPNPPPPPPPCAQWPGSRAGVPTHSAAARG